MFTGLIERTGEVRSAVPRAAGSRIEVAAEGFGGEVALGDSIAVNGVCLTVTEMAGDTFSFDVSPETLRRSTLGRLRRGSMVNLERALRLSDRLGGHFVTGHIDGTGILVGTRRVGEFSEFTFRAGAEVLDCSVSKGSVAVDGISLTIAELTSNGFTVAVIPHTAGITTLSGLRAGDTVNLEADLIGKYVVSFMERRSGGGGNDRFVERLKEEGFMR